MNCIQHNHSMCPDIYKTPVCPYCGGTGQSTIERQQGEDMVQRQVPCECTLPQDDTEARKDYDLHEEAGLVWGGLNTEGENDWIGTDKQWEKYKELKKQK